MNGHFYRTDARLVINLAFRNGSDTVGLGEAGGGHAESTTALYRQAVGGAARKGILHVTGAFAEFERNMIRTRVNAGWARCVRGVCAWGVPSVGRKVEAALPGCLAIRLPPSRTQSRAASG
jgi:hypothetical protein